MENRSWENEFFDLQFSDKRLQKRFFQMMDSFSQKPGQSILTACGSRSQAKAIYRLLANNELSYEELLNSISQATIQKMKQLSNEKIQQKLTNSENENQSKKKKVLNGFLHCKNATKQYQKESKRLRYVIEKVIFMNCLQRQKSKKKSF